MLGFIWGGIGQYWNTNGYKSLETFVLFGCFVCGVKSLCSQGIEASKTVPISN